MNEKQTFSIRVHPEIMKVIKLQAARDQVSISSIIETALKKYLEVKTHE